MGKYHDVSGFACTLKRVGRAQYFYAHNERKYMYIVECGIPVIQCVCEQPFLLT